VRAECLAAASLIAGLEERDLTLRIDADAAAGTVRVEVVDAQGRVAACLAGRDVLELLCVPRVPR
jgi:hypothetical protein